MALLVRRKWWIVAPFVALSCLAAILTRFLPRTYVSESLILVRPRDVPADFVKDLIAGTADQRLRSIEQEVLSRTNLIQILREFGDSLPDFRGLNIDDQIQKLRKQINIVMDLEKRDGITLPLTYFRISYQSPDPELAQKVASKLTSLFIEQDSRVREAQVFGTTEFLSTELEKVSEQLKESESKLKEVKSTRLFELPDQRDANLRTLDRLGVDKKANAEALDRYATIRLTLESQLSQTPETISRTTLAAQPPKNPQVEEYRKAKHDYEDAVTKYTEKHPEVQGAKARLEHLKKDLSAELLAAAEAPDTAATVGTSVKEPNPLYQSLIAQLQEVKTEFAIREREKAWIESEIGKYNTRVENTPRTEQDIAEVQRQNDDLKKQYEDLKNKLAQAKLAESLESRQKNGQFQVIDPANYPLIPSKPNKFNVLTGACMGSLFLSIALAVAVDILRQKVWTQAQVEALWGIPVLVDIPQILTDADLVLARRKRRINAVTWVAATVAYSFCLYGVYVKHAFILRNLDPVLQKLIYK